MRPAIALLLLLATTGCGGASAPADAPLAVSAIGARAAPGDPSAIALDPARRLLMDATAQGLVRFDGAGGIEPGLAERWIVLPDGLSYIFRLREAYWPDGNAVTAEEVARSLRRATAPGSRNPLAPFLAVIDEIVPMTGNVVEVRLKRQRPDLLKLFAQPEMAVFQAGGLSGSGPYRVRPDAGGGALLTRIPPPQIAGEDEAAPPGPSIRLRGERAAMAIARFKNGAADAVLGGSYMDWPIVQVADMPRAAIRIDPAAGLFGLAIVRREGFLANPANRIAIGAAMDRAALTASFDASWSPLEALLPAQLDSAAPPTAPPWASLPLAERRTAARARVAAWQRTHGPVRLRIAFPASTGSTLTWTTVARSLLAIGITPIRVAMNEETDLRLLDAVAPYDSARWYLTLACRLCSQEAATLIQAARDAPTLEERARRLAEADAALTADAAFIPLAQPFRWAIVTERVTGWQGNTRAWHPLNHLRNEGE